MYNLGFPSTKIDTVPFSDLIEEIKLIYNKIKPSLVYMPFFKDVHTDHQIISKALQSTIKWFRFNYIRKVYMYETVSETDFNFLGEKSF